MGLIKTINEWRNVMPLASEISVESLPKTDIVEQKYLLPILGQALYDELHTPYSSNQALTNAQSKLLAYCQGVIAPYAVIRSIALKQTTLGKGGLIVNETEKNPRPFRWQYNEYIQTLYDTAYEYFELLIMYLRENRSTFSNWASSPYNAATNQHIIRDGADLQSVLSVDMPHRCFWAIKPLLDSHCVEYAVQSVGQAYYADLNGRLKADDVSKTGNEYINIVRKMQMAMARKAMKHAAIEMNIRFSANGFTIVDQIKENTEEGRTNAAADRLASFAKEMDASADAFMQQAVDYLNANASGSLYAAYFGSSNYSSPTATTTTPKEYKGLFVGR